MAAQLGHQAGTRLIEETPAHQLLHAVVAEIVNLRRQLLLVLGVNEWPPAVAPQQQAAFVILQAFRICIILQFRPGVVAMPQGADVPDVAQFPGPHQLDGVGVKQTVMALMAYVEDLLLLFGDLDHLFTLRDVPGHQLLAQDVLAGIHGFHGHGSMQVERQGDDDRFNVFSVQQILVIVINGNVLLGRLDAVDAVEAQTGRRRRFTGKDALLIAGTNVGHSDELQIFGIVEADEDAALVAGADQADLDGAALPGLVAEVSGRGQRHRGSGGQQAFHEVATGDISADGFLKGGLAFGFFSGVRYMDIGGFLG